MKWLAKVAKLGVNGLGKSLKGLELGSVLTNKFIFYAVVAGLLLLAHTQRIAGIEQHLQRTQYELETARSSLIICEREEMRAATILEVQTERLSVMGKESEQKAKDAVATKEALKPKAPGSFKDLEEMNQWFEQLY